MESVRYRGIGMTAILFKCVCGWVKLESVRVCGKREEEDKMYGYTFSVDLYVSVV